MFAAASASPYLGYVFVVLSTLAWAAIAPLTRAIETEASRYTYHVGRSFFSMLFVFGLIRATGASALGRPGNRIFFLCFAAGQWFFLWGYVKAMATLDSTTWAVVHCCTYPVFAAAAAELLAPQMLDAGRDKIQWGFFSYQLARNAATIYLMCMDTAVLTLQLGIGWCLLTAAAQGCQSAVLRGVRRTDSSLTCVLYADVINLLLWLPPGAGNVRIPFLWPEEAPNANLAVDTTWPLSSHVWAALVLCGLLGMAGMTLIGQAVKTLPVGPVTAFAAPLEILFCLAFDTVLGVKQLSAAQLVGAGLFVGCTVAEGYLGLLRSGSDPEPESAEATRMNGKQPEAYGTTDERKLPLV